MPDDSYVLNKLREKGADLSQARDFKGHLWFDERSQADEAAADLEPLGFGNEVVLIEGRWVLLAGNHGVVDEETIGGLSATFERVAASHGGVFHGLEATP